VSLPLVTSATHRVETAQHVLRAPRVLALWHLASFDAPTVAVVWSLAFAWCTGVRLQWWLPVLQALGVWTVYVADRLLDARRALRDGSVDNLRERHFFHWRHRSIFLPLAVAAASVCAGLIFCFMPLAARERDSFFAAAALVYFARVHSGGTRNKPSVRLRIPLFSKELLVGVIFTAGCALPAIARAFASDEPLWPLLVPAFCFALLAWLNCHAIDGWESQKPTHPTCTTSLAAGCLAAACLLLAWFACAGHPRTAALLAAGAASALLLALLDRVRPRLTPLMLRATADLVLLTPLALIVVPQRFMT
jgi:hypothetical protein